MQLIIVSDLHLGKGKYLANGQLNILEDFDEDERFVEFLEHYSSGVNYFTDVHLVFNGDIFNLMHLDINDVHTHLITEEMTVKMMDDIISGHPIFFQGLRKFLSRPNKQFSYVFGNHDFGMIWPAVQERLNTELGTAIHYTDQLITNDVLIEHGHRFEPENTVPKSKQIVDGPAGQKILNLPWASLFCIYMLPRLKFERPHIDKVRPMSLYIRWALIHDTRFFLKLCMWISFYLLKTQLPKYTKYNKNFRLKLNRVFRINIHPRYEKNARRIFATKPEVQVVVMGHTHVAEWRRFKDGKLYLNCGTWNPVPSVDAALNSNITDLSYVLIDVNEKKKQIKNIYLNSWRGKWRPYREEVSTTLL